MILWKILPEIIKTSNAVHNNAEHGVIVLESLKTCVISENKSLNLCKDGQKFFLEVCANGYVVKVIAGTTMQAAETYYLGVINKLRDGLSVFEAIHT